jgi:hypothetical protein
MAGSAETHCYVDKDIGGSLGCPKRLEYSFPGKAYFIQKNIRALNEKLEAPAKKVASVYREGLATH